MPRRTERVPAPLNKPATNTVRPEFIEPMAAQIVKTLPEGPDWLYELKFDGYRGLLINKPDNEDPSLVVELESEPVQVTLNG